MVCELLIGRARKNRTRPRQLSHGQLDCLALLPPAPACRGDASGIECVRNLPTGPHEDERALLLGQCGEEVKHERVYGPAGTLKPDVRDGCLWPLKNPYNTVVAQMARSGPGGQPVCSYIVLVSIL